MGFGGSVLGMIMSLNQNRRLRKGRRKLKDLDKDSKFKSTQRLKEHSISPDKLNDIKSQIALKTKRDRKRSRLLSIFVFTVIIISLSYLLYNKMNKVKEDVIEYKNDRKAHIESVKKRHIENENYRTKKWLYASASEYLKNGEYKLAKEYLYKVQKIDSTNLKFKIAYHRAVVYDCIENNIGCDSAQLFIKKLHKKYPDDDNISYLFNLLSD